MQLTALDWAVLAAYFVFNIGVGFYYRESAGKSIDDFFVSGRSVPWWLAGTSMIATTFAADTPLAVTGMVAAGGIAGNWLWWNFAFSGMLTVFFYSRLWRRCGVLTDVEFAEIRYAGKPAAFLRGFRALYLAGPINCIVMGWVNLAMVKILQLVLGVDKQNAILLVLVLTAITCLISALSGLTGVLITDFVQFVIMMVMALVLAVVSVNAVGGIGAIEEKLIAAGKGDALNFFPAADSALLPVVTFFVYIAVNWWATWYPGAEPGGGGFIAQRMLSSRDERHSFLATLWFNVGFYAVRPWPWILVALVALAMHPDLADAESGYVVVMLDHLPPSLRGLMLAGFLAAFMSTISTELNWGASYFINDFYRRFVKPEASEKHLVQASRISTVVLAIAAATITFYMDSISGAWKLLIVTGGQLLRRSCTTAVRLRQMTARSTGTRFDPYSSALLSTAHLTAPPHVEHLAITNSSWVNGFDCRRPWRTRFPTSAVPSARAGIRLGDPWAIGVTTKSRAAHAQRQLRPTSISPARRPYPSRS
jgi:Na+/proline symporter